MADNQSTLSIRVPRLTRALVSEASEKTGQGIAEYYITAATAAANGVLEKEKNLKLLPKWFPLDERDRQMVSMMIDNDDLKVGKEAAKRLMTPHTRFMVWAVTLVALSDLSKGKVQEIAARVDHELNGAHQSNSP